LSAGGAAHGGRNVVIAGAVRTAIGKFGGALAGVHVADLGASAVRAALARAGVAPEQVDETIVGHARQAGNGPNVARQVAHFAGVPDAKPAYTINKACASGLQAIVSAAQAVALGDSDVVLTAGAENMSAIPFLLPDERWGRKLGDMPLVDAMYRDGYLCRLCNQVMGETAETLVTRYNLTRGEQDAYALRSHQRASAAWARGDMAAEITPVTVRAARGGGEVAFERDEAPRADTTLEALGKLPPVFKKDGSVGAGNSSAITDGAAAAVVLAEERASALGLVPMARVLAWASAGVDAAEMGLGPVPAVRQLFARTGLTMKDMDLVELNEAFASQVLACDRELNFDPERLNVNGGAIALGHPTGCSGTRIVVTLLHELARRKGRYGLATLCVSGGQGMAVLFERL